MEEEKKLYPFKFCTLQDDYPWGSEEFKLADLGYRDSLVREGWLAGNSIAELMDTYLDRIVGDDVYAWYGRQFPITSRFIRPGGDALPLMVCPDDETAFQRMDSLGKAKLWYVVDAGEDALISIGFGKDVVPADFYMACRHAGTSSDEIKAMLYTLRPRKGEHFFIAPGTVHTASGHLTILEIAECSPLDFRIFDWGRETQLDDFDAELNLDAAFDFIDWKAYKAPAPEHHHHHHGTPEEAAAENIADCPEFSVTEVKLRDPMHIYSEQFGCFVLYTCAEGEISLQIPASGAEPQLNIILKAGESALVPAEVPDFFLVPLDRSSVLLETIVKRRPEIDSYTLEEQEDDGEEHTHDEGHCHCHDADDEDCDCHDHECHCHED